MKFKKIILMMMAVFVLAGCSSVDLGSANVNKKTGCNRDKFIVAVEKTDAKVSEELKDEMGLNDESLDLLIEDTEVAMNEDEDLIFMYFDLKSETYAEFISDAMLTVLQEEYPEIAEMLKETKGDNYLTKETNMNGLYVNISRVDDTLLVALGAEDNAKVAKVVAEKLGY